jgi:hypothetical protein
VFTLIAMADQKKTRNRRLETDPEPDHDQRYNDDTRRRENRVEIGLQDIAHTDPHTHHDPERNADDHGHEGAEKEGLHGDLCGRLQFPGSDQFDEFEKNDARGREQKRVDTAAYELLPAENDDEAHKRQVNTGLQYFRDHAVDLKSSGTGV